MRAGCQRDDTYAIGPNERILDNIQGVHGRVLRESRANIFASPNFEQCYLKSDCVGPLLRLANFQQRLGITNITKDCQPGLGAVQRTARAAGAGSVGLTRRATIRIPDVST